MKQQPSSRKNKRYREENAQQKCDEQKTLIT